MRKIAKKFGIHFGISIMLLGCTIALNIGILSAKARVDNKIKTEKQEDTGVNQVNSVIKESTAKPTLTITVGKSDPNQVPSDKDITMDDAAYKIADYVKFYMNADVENSTVEMQFVKEGSAFVKREMWCGYLTLSDNSASFWSQVDSVTGQIYILSRHDNFKSADTRSGTMFGEGVTDEGAAIKKQLEIKDYCEAAAAFVKAKFPDKQIVSTKNIYCGSINVITKEKNPGYYNFIIQTAVELSDGTGYMMSVGAVSHNIYSFDFYPNGVQTFLMEDPKYRMEQGL